MAKFKEVMKQWARMCDSHSDCYSCPMRKEEDLPYTLCSEGGIRSVEAPERAEEVIMNWAADHPEPVYPTWGEYQEYNRFRPC